MRSSSLHKLNGDNSLRLYELLLWLILNALNNAFLPHSAGSHLHVRNYKTLPTDEDWAQLHIENSPARKLSNLFWLNLPWVSIEEEIGPINVVDVGCGAGGYGAKLQAWSGGRIATYTGIDRVESENWENLTATHDNFRFHKARSDRIFELIPDGANFFISQSAIEHFDEDLSYFEEIRRYIVAVSDNVIQVHLFPSGVCLRLYPWHGVRQYTPRTVSLITRLFRDYSYAVLFGLGGPACNAVHWQYITSPQIVRRIGDQRHEKAQEYDKKLREAIELDMRGQSRNPTFYGLVIHSHYQAKILL